MAPVDLKELSTNWKKLQQTLQKRQENGEVKSAKPNPLKRKSGNEAGPPRYQSGVKRVKKDADDSKNRPSHSITRKIMNESHASSTNTLPSSSHTVSPSIPPLLDPNGLNLYARPGKYISIDCEMVGTGPPPTHQPSILARVSIVTYHSQILYDTYVLPYPASTRITDFRTFVSGITPFHISPSNPSAQPFPLVQRTVAELLQGRILIGHALKHDLEVLGLKHPRRDIRDTARYPEWRRLHAGGKTPALRKLAKEVLGWDIQGGQHSSVEDAKAAMELWKGERNGFEREHVRVWGVDRRVFVKGKMVNGEVKGTRRKGVNGQMDDGHENQVSDDEDEEDEDVFDDEDEVSLSDELEGATMGVKSPQAQGAGQKKKKKKRKKRTKR